jgi:cell division protein FtsZ
MIDFELESQSKSVATIKVVGVGGAGGNTVNSIIASGYQGIDFIAINTDSQALEISKAPQKIQIGIKSTKGLGTGADPELGKRAAEEDLDKVMEALEDSDIVFLAAGMGGGTGSGGLPIIARALREKGILTIAIVTKPFLFEGKRRARIAQQAIDLLAQEVDTLIVIPNQKLLEVVDENVSMIDGFAMINDILTQSVRGISNIITRPGHINVDFADVRAIMKTRGLAVMGTGKASGPNRAKEAALQAISSPLLENMNIAGVHSALLNISGGKNLGLHEIGQAASVIYEQAHEDANIIIGSVIDESLTDEVIVTIIATGFDHEGRQACSLDTMNTVHVSASLDLSQTAKKEKPVEEERSVQTQEPAEAAAEKKEEEATSLNTDSHYIDLNDLDIPSFLRRELHQDDSE